MDEIIEALRLRLLGRSDITSLTDKRIYSDVIPTGTILKPIIVLLMVSGESTENIATASGQASVRVQVSCFARQAEDANLLRERVRLASQGYQGYWSSDTRTFRIQDVSFAAGTDFALQPVDASDRFIYNRSIDILITFDEVVPQI